MPRTVTRNEQTLVLRGDDTLSFFHPPENSPNPSFPVRLHIAPGSIFDVPPHFHLKHDEIFCIEQGELDITLNGETRRYNASSGVVKIPRGVIHSFRGQAPPDAPIITWEKTSPHDREKEFMFRNMFSIMQASSLYRKSRKLGFSDAMQINLTTYYCDGYLAPLPVLGTRINLFISGALAWIAKFAGYRVAYPEYIADELWEGVKKSGKAL